MNLQEALRIFEIIDSNNINEEIIRSKYRKLCFLYHPDAHPNEDIQKYHDKMSEINRAYEALKTYIKNRNSFNESRPQHFKQKPENRQNQQRQTSSIQIPTFSELKNLAFKYEMFIERDYFNPNVSEIKVRDIKTGQVIIDKSIIDRAIFANIWLASAGIKSYMGELRPGETYAFSESAEELYNTICVKLLYGCRIKGVIDTVDLFRSIDNNNTYKYNKEIIVNLFSAAYQTEMINKLFLKSLGINQQRQTPETLYSMKHAYELAFGEENNNTKGI